MDEKKKYKYPSPLRNPYFHLLLKDKKSVKV